MQRFYMDSRLSIEPYCFSKCSNLQNVIFEEESQLTTISKYSFENTQIQNIKIPQHIREWAFIDCNQLKTIEFSSNSELQTIDQYAFS